MSRARRYVAQNKRRGKILHLSAVIVHHKDPETGLRVSYVRKPGTTYRGSARGNAKRNLAGMSGRQRRKFRKAFNRAMRKST